MENEFDRIVRDAKFAYDLMEQNREMERFVNESLILASGNKQAINEMAIIHEAAAGDKIKSFFEKIKNFFKKIFDKLGASMSALFKEQKDYIDKYANICVKCKWNVGDVSDLYDIFTGLPRIISVVDTGDEAIFGANSKRYFDQQQAGANELNLTDFQDAKKVKEAAAKIKPLDPAEAKATAFDEFTKSGYWSGLSDFAGAKQNASDGKVDIAKTFQTWFQGSADTITIDGNKMEDNFRTCINVCYAGQSYLNKLEKIVTTVNKKMDDAQKSMENYHKAQKEKILALAKENEGQGHQGKADIPWDSIKTHTSGDYTPKDHTGKDIDADKIEAADYAGDPKKLAELLKQKGYNVTGIPEDTNNQSQQNNKQKPVQSNCIRKNPNDNTKYQICKAGDGQTFEGDYDSFDAAKSALKTSIDQNKFDAKEIDSFSESFNMYRDFRNYFNELTTNTKASNADNAAAKNSVTGSGNPQNTNASNTATNLSNKTANTMTAQDNLTVAGGIAAEAEKLLTQDITNREIEINANVNISTSIATAAFNAFKYINKECFEAVKAHVQWYLSNPGAENDAANQTARPRSLEMNAAQPAVTSTATNNTTDNNKA